MDQTGTYVVQETAKLHDMLRQMSIFEDDGQLEAYCLGYLKKKIGNKPLRAYFIRKLYEYLSEYEVCAAVFQAYPDSQNLFLRKLPFVFETVITIQYLHNHILDEKYDTKSQNHPKIIQNLISGNVLRELLFRYLEQEIAPHFPNRDLTDVIIQNVRRLLLWVDTGQYLDKEYNHYKRWKEKLPAAVTPSPFFDGLVHQAIDETISRVKTDVPGKEAFVEAYFQRIYLSNVYFFRCMAETLMALGNYEGEQKTPLLTYSIRYGFMLQIINDYADFAYTEDKKEQKNLRTAGKKTTDVFADLYNFNITLPLIYHLRSETRRKIESYLEGGAKKRHLLSDYPKQIMQEITQSGGIQEAILRSLELSRSAKTALDLNNPQSDFFADMCDMAIDNKFYRIFK